MEFKYLPHEQQHKSIQQINKIEKIIQRYKDSEYDSRSPFTDNKCVQSIQDVINNVTDMSLYIEFLQDLFLHKKIKSIKQLRQITYCGLKESKEHVESLEDKLEEIQEHLNEIRYVYPEEFV